MTFFYFTDIQFGNIGYIDFSSDNCSQFILKLGGMGDVSTIYKRAMIPQISFWTGADLFVGLFLLFFLIDNTNYPCNGPQSDKCGE